MYFRLFYAFIYVFERGFFQQPKTRPIALRWLIFDWKSGCSGFGHYRQNVKVTRIGMTSICITRSIVIHVVSSFLVNKISIINKQEMETQLWFFRIKVQFIHSNHLHEWFVSLRIKVLLCILCVVKIQSLYLGYPIE